MSAPRVEVTPAGPDTFRVVIREGASATEHHVGCDARTCARYAPAAAAGELVRAAVTFLLDREPKESILARFDLPVIERYFPEFPAQIGRYLEPPPA